MSSSVPEVHHGHRGGIPLLWAPADGDPRVELVFRVGRIDEPYARGGISHLCEHLVLTELGLPAYAFNGYAGIETTGFTARGTVEEVSAFLEHVVASVQDLPMGRLTHERGVLENEAAAHDGLSVGDAFGQMRWGLAPLGRRGTAELGVRAADADAIRAWARDHFVRESAVLCWIGPEPPEFAWRLPGGTALDEPTQATASHLPLPYIFDADQDEIALGVTLTPGPSALVFAELLRLRVTRELRHDRGLVYDVDVSFAELSGTVAEFPLVVEQSGARGAEIAAVVLDELRRLAEGTVEDADLAASRRRIADLALESDWLEGQLHEMAVAHLTGRTARSPKDELAAVAAVDASAIAARAQEATASALLVAPDSVPRPPGWNTADTAPPAPAVGGTTFRSGGRLARRRDHLTIGDEGFSLATDGGETVTILWRDVVAVTRERDGSYYLTGQDAAWCTVHPSSFRGDAEAIAAAIEHHLDPATIIQPLGVEHEAKLAELVRRDLKKPEAQREELLVVPSLLDHGEGLLALSQAINGIHVGLLVVTDLRTIFIELVDDERRIDEIPHAGLREVRVDKSWKGVSLVLDVHPEPRSYWGADPQEHAERVREIIATRMAA